MKAETSNSVRTYQQFCDRNLAFKKREDELQLSINELEAKRAELQRTLFIEPQLEFQENNVYKDNLDLEVKQEEVISINDELIPSPNIAINYNINENKILHYASSPMLPLNDSSSQLFHIQDGLSSAGGGSRKILDTAEFFMPI